MKHDFLSLAGFGEAASKLPIEQRVHLIRIETFFGHAPGNALGIAASALMFAVVLDWAGLDRTTLLLWVGVQVLTLFLCLIPTVIVGVLAAKLAEHLGCRKEMAEKIGIIATLPCLYYFFF